mmetsp:Transcript_4682/g.6787  ORF Transcript_4682/g.6787 Transcript_4682/m.6787 type:complete len:418 (+) Transcript_4682:63-1316(+)
MMLWTVNCILVLVIAIINLAEGYNDQTIVIPQQSRDREIYVIGDLHGDVDCAKYWVNRIGVVDDIENPKQWLEEGASLIFMGDYIDRGPFSHQTLLLVKNLTDAFPNRVTALMGNHEMEILKDRHPSRKMKYFYYPNNVIHPSEYSNHITYRDWESTDDLVVDLLLNASLRVYSELRKDGPPVHFSPEKLPETFAPNPQRKCVVDFVEDETKKKLVRERLEEYQKAYLDTFMSSSVVGMWMEKTLKVAHIENGILFTHGGIRTSVAIQLTSNFSSIEELNEEVTNNLSDDDFFPFIIQNPTGRMVESMLYYRGNHEEGACLELLENFQRWGGVHVLAVGHTPNINIRRKCGDQFLALDSLLGRWIRSSGGFHCAQGKPRSRGKFTCPRIQQKCRGQIVKISPDGNLQVLDGQTDQQS